MKTIRFVIAAVAISCSAVTFAYDQNTPQASIVVEYIDPAGQGFNDPGLGAQRKAALEYACSIWAGCVKGTIPIKVRAQCQELGGDAGGAVLASAGATAAGHDGVTYFGIPLLNQMANSDLNGSAAEIQVNVNSDVDNSTVLGTMDFYYGTDGNPGGDIDFVSVILHELGHGMGFSTFMADTGAWLNNRPDTFGRNLSREGFGALTGLTDLGRSSAAISGNLVWTGSSVTNRQKSPGVNYGNVKMYAPNPYEPGSSVSHFDTSNNPSLLMEPNYTGVIHSLDITPNALFDMGWFVDPNSLPVTVSGVSIE